MKGIVLAGGTGSRLWPSTFVTCKQLLPVYDKPMIYYPLSTLMLAGIRDILLICTAQDLGAFQKLLEDGSQFGVNITYKVQPSPDGLAQAYVLGAEFISGHSSLMILGDNIFHGASLGEHLEGLNQRSTGAHIFTYPVADPSQYGVLEIDSEEIPLSVMEKPKSSNSNLAITGLYFFDKEVESVARAVKPSSRGELEITSVIESYLERKDLTFSKLGRGHAWLDTGSPNSLHDASTYIKIIEERTGQKIACLEEIAFSKDWISRNTVENQIEKYRNNDYAKYLKKIID